MCWMRERRWQGMLWYVSTRNGDSRVLRLTFLGWVARCACLGPRKPCKSPHHAQQARNECCFQRHLRERASVVSQGQVVGGVLVRCSKSERMRIRLHYLLACVILAIAPWVCAISSPSKNTSDGVVSTTFFSHELDRRRASSYDARPTAFPISLEAQQQSHFLPPLGLSAFKSLSPSQCDGAYAPKIGVTSCSDGRATRW